METRTLPAGNLLPSGSLSVVKRLRRRLIFSLSPDCGQKYKFGVVSGTSKEPNLQCLRLFQKELRSADSGNRITFTCVNCCFIGSLKA